MARTDAHARRILTAWNSADASLIRTELNSAEQHCHRIARSTFEEERRELLAAVTGELRNGRRTEAALTLLSHLGRE